MRKRMRKWTALALSGMMACMIYLPAVPIQGAVQKTKAIAYAPVSDGTEGGESDPLSWERNWNMVAITPKGTVALGKTGTIYFDLYVPQSFLKNSVMGDLNMEVGLDYRETKDGEVSSIRVPWIYQLQKVGEAITGKAVPYVEAIKDYDWNQPKTQKAIRTIPN